MPHYTDGTPAKHGDLIIRHQDYDNSDTLLLLTTINVKSDSCNASAIPLATKQGDAPWFPFGLQTQWTVTLKECRRIDRPPKCEVEKASESAS